MGDYNIHVVLVDFIDRSNAGGQYGGIELRSCPFHEDTSIGGGLYFGCAFEDSRGDLLSSLYLFAIRLCPLPNLPQDVLKGNEFVDLYP